MWLDSTGKTEPLLASPGAYYTPRLSPDGKRLAVSVNTNAIGVYDSQRDTMTPLTFKPQFTLFPVWTPDGKHIVFAATAGASSTLQWIRSDGAGEPQQLLESKTDLRPYSFSPDGKRLAFAESRAETGYDLWTLPLDLSDPEHPKAGKPELFLRTMARRIRTRLLAGWTMDRLPLLRNGSHRSLRPTFSGSGRQMADFHRRRTPPGLVAKRAGAVLSGAGLPHHGGYVQRERRFVCRR